MKFELLHFTALRGTNTHTHTLFLRGASRKEKKTHTHNHTNAYINSYIWWKATEHTNDSISPPLQKQTFRISLSSLWSVYHFVTLSVSFCAIMCICLCFVALVLFVHCYKTIHILAVIESFSFFDRGFSINHRRIVPEMWKAVAHGSKGMARSTCNACGMCWGRPVGFGGICMMFEWEG